MLHYDGMSPEPQIGFLSGFFIDDENEPQSLDPKKHTADGNFTGIDEEGRL